LQRDRFRPLGANLRLHVTDSVNGPKPKGGSPAPVVRGEVIDRVATIKDSLHRCPLKCGTDATGAHLRPGFWHRRGSYNDLGDKSVYSDFHHVGRVFFANDGSPAAQRESLLGTGCGGTARKPWRRKRLKAFASAKARERPGSHERLDECVLLSDFRHGGARLGSITGFLWRESGWCAGGVDICVEASETRGNVRRGFHYHTDSERSSRCGQPTVPTFPSQRLGHACRPRTVGRSLAWRRGSTSITASRLGARSAED
jgi:hypothetical protein